MKVSNKLPLPIVTASKQGRNKRVVYTDSRYIFTPMNRALKVKIQNVKNFIKSKRKQTQPKCTRKKHKNPQQANAILLQLTSTCSNSIKTTLQQGVDYTDPTSLSPTFILSDHCLLNNNARNRK